MDAVPVPTSESPPKTHTPQAHTQRSTSLDRTLEAGKGCDLSVTPEDPTAERTDRALTERLIELEREVCIYVCVCGPAVPKYFY